MAEDAPRLGLIAGGGLLPRLVADQCRADGRDLFVLMLEGHAEPDAYADLPTASLPIVEAPRGFDLLAEQGVRQVVFAGHIQRPSLKSLKPSWRTARFLARVAGRAIGDDGLLSALVAELEAAGFEVIGAEEIVGGLLARRGAMGAVTLPDAYHEDVARGMAVLTALGEQDVGQACVVQDGVVLGIEGVEGTDALIARCAMLANADAARRPVLVKASKTGQDGRVDLPTVGPGTVAGLTAGGYAGLAVEAGGVLVLERETVVQTADDAGLFVVGVSTVKATAG